MSHSLLVKGICFRGQAISLNINFQREISYELEGMNQMKQVKVIVICGCLFEMFSRNENKPFKKISFKRDW